MSETENALNWIGELVFRFVKEALGSGPTSISVHSFRNVIRVELGGTLTVLESVILQQPRGLHISARLWRRISSETVAALKEALAAVDLEIDSWTFRRRPGRESAAFVLVLNQEPLAELVIASRGACIEAGLIEWESLKKSRVRDGSEARTRTDRTEKTAPSGFEPGTPPTVAFPRISSGDLMKPVFDRLLEPTTNRVSIVQALDGVRESTGADACELFLWNEATNSMVLLAHSGADSGAFHAMTHFPRGLGFPGRVAETGNPVITTQLPLDRSFLRGEVKQAGYQYFGCFPIYSRGCLVGSLNVAARERLPQPIEDGMPGLCKLLAACLEREGLLTLTTLRIEALEWMERGVLTLLDRLIDMGSFGRPQSSFRTAYLARQLAVKASFPAHDLRWVQWGTVLRDIGQIAVPARVLADPGPPTEVEMHLIRQHPEIGVELLDTFPISAIALSIVRHHHERFDGQGYPDGLEGDAIPLAARIVAIADAFDALLCVRPYRGGMSPNEALEEVKRQAGSQFDPELVRGFVGIVESTDWARLDELLTRAKLLAGDVFPGELEGLEGEMAGVCESCARREAHCPTGDCPVLANHAHRIWATSNAELVFVRGTKP